MNRFYDRCNRFLYLVQQLQPYRIALSSLASGIILVLLSHSAHCSTAKPDAVYYWGVGDVSTCRANEILFFAGEATFREGELVFQPVTLPEHFPRSAALTAVLRFSPPVLERLLADDSRREHIDAILQRLERFSVRFDRSIALQLDADCPTRLADDYLAFASSLRVACPTDLSITITASWLEPSMLRRVFATAIPAYAMLYTMAPGRDLDHWRGEVPEDLWHRALAHLGEVSEQTSADENRVTVVLPCYDLVTIYDDRGKRLCRHPRKDWLNDALTQPGALHPRPSPGEPGIGSLETWTVMRTGRYGDHILRAGSVIAREEFSYADWRAARATIRKASPHSRIGLYHVGNIDDTNPETEHD